MSHSQFFLMLKLANILLKITQSLSPLHSRFWRNAMSIRHTSQQVGQSVALEDPAYRQDKRLVHSLKEVTKISEFFQNDCVKVIMGLEASIDKLLNSVNLPVDMVQGFVHTAAHGLVNHKNRSGSLL